MAVNQPIRVCMYNNGGESPYKNSKTRLWAMFNYYKAHVTLFAAWKK